MTVGFLLGLGIAYLFYRQTFQPLTDSKAGQPFLLSLEGVALPAAIAVIVKEAWLGAAAASCAHETLT